MLDYSKYEAIRKEFHRIPEYAFEEHKTHDLIMHYLNLMPNKDKCSIKIIEPTGILVDIPSRTNEEMKKHYNIAFRADIDGLKIEEKAKLEWKSTIPGMMHACGHDSHITIILGFIEILLRNIEVLEKSNYGFRLIFQPAEEVGKGALKMISKGAIENINEIFGIHNTSPLQLNEIGTVEGVMMGRIDRFEITISEGINNILCASNIINLINQIRLKAVCAVCSINYDKNISDKVELKGTFRTYINPIGDEYQQKIRSVCENITKIYNCKYKLEFKSRKALVNSKSSTEDVMKLLHDGQYKLNTVGLPSMASDDFSNYLAHIPGCYFGFGISESEKETKYIKMHNSNYCYNDKATKMCVQFLCRLIETKCKIVLK